MRYLSVCSGIEAATAAWHPLGWKPAAYSEIEAFPRAVLRHYYPDVPLHGDFTTIRGDEYGAIDLLVGGTPCQSFSVAGLRGGLVDNRGNLALEFLKLADRTRPRWIVWENVPGVFSSLSHDAPDPCPPNIDLDAGDGPRDGDEVVVADSYDSDESHAFACFMAGLQELGYGAAYRVLDAQYAGVPQRRRRVFVVGYFGDWRRAAAVLFERHSLSGNPAPRREAGKGIAASTRDGLAATLGSKRDGGWRGDLDNETYVARCVTTGEGSRQDYETCTLVSHPLTAGMASSASRMPHEQGALIPVTFDTTQITSSGNYSQPKPGDPCHPLAAGAHAPAVAFSITPSNSNKDYNARRTDKAQALTAGGNRPSSRGGDIVASSAVRRLTPMECERLQGFPDNYTLIPVRGKPAADGPRYKALGNTMAVPVMRWIGERIQMVEQLMAARVAA